MDQAKDYIPNPESKCTYGKNEKGSVHSHCPPKSLESRYKIMNNISEVIGWTPMVRLSNISKKFDLDVELVAKCEFLNPGGSVKDRIGVRIVDDYVNSGKMEGKTTLVEATSGNTGIGLAMVCASRGFKSVIYMPDKMSKEKNDILFGLGSEIIRTKIQHGYGHPENHMEQAIKRVKEDPQCILADQYYNPSNPLAHYDGTGAEIVTQLDGHCDYLFIGAGTGGTMTGIARKVREKMPACRIIGVDPYGSILALPEELNTTEVQSYDVEGIGYDFIPAVCDRHAPHEWMKTDDKETYIWARRLLKYEGLLCGGSSGTCMAAAVRYIREHPQELKGKRCCIILPDNIRNYMTKHLDNEWLLQRGHIQNIEELN